MDKKQSATVKEKDLDTAKKSKVVRRSGDIRLGDTQLHKLGVCRELVVDDVIPSRLKGLIDEEQLKLQKSEIPRKSLSQPQPGTKAQPEKSSEQKAKSKINLKGSKSQQKKSVLKSPSAEKHTKAEKELHEDGDARFQRSDSKIKESLNGESVLVRNSKMLHSRTAHLKHVLEYNGFPFV